MLSSMDDCQDATAAIDGHLAAALVLLANCFGHEGPARQAELVDAARLLSLAREGVARPPVRAIAPVAMADPESDDERIERRAAEAVARTDAVLAGMDLTAAERRWARRIGGELVDLVSDAYRRSVGRADGFCGTCVTAAAATALAIVYEPRDG